MIREDSMYDHDYYDDPESASGYTDYKDGDWSNWLCDLFIEQFRPRRVLDVGCAKGYLLGRFIERGIDAVGIDMSEYAVSAAAEHVRPRIQMASILEMPFPDNAFDLVICMETLEHIEPHLVPQAVSELARVSSQHVLATIPSFGFNDYGPQGLAMTTSQREDAEAGLPFQEINFDEKGRPHHGHVTLATYRWWTQRFAEAGLYRMGWLERRMSDDERMKKLYFQMYALRKTGEPSLATLWPPIRKPEVVAGKNDAGQLGPGFYHFDHLLGGRWTRDQALFWLSNPGRSWLYVEYMVPAGLPESAGPYLRVEGRKQALPEEPGGWVGHHVRLEGKGGELPVLLGVERDWSPAAASWSQDDNRYGLALRYAGVCRVNSGKARLHFRRLSMKLVALAGKKRLSTP